MLFYELKIICLKIFIMLLIVIYVINLVKGFLLGFIIFINVFKSIMFLSFVDNFFKNKGLFYFKVLF